MNERGTLATGATIRIKQGTVSTPSLSFTDDTTTGLYLKSPGSIALSVAGVDRFVITNSTLELKVAGITTVGDSLGLTNNFHRYISNIGGTLTVGNEDTIKVAVVNSPTFVPTYTGGSSGLFAVNHLIPQYNMAESTNIEMAAGLLIFGGTLTGTGTIDRAYGIYAAKPTFGTSRIAAYFENMAIGDIFTASMPPTNGAVIEGSVGIGSQPVTRSKLTISAFAVPGQPLADYNYHLTMTEAHDSTSPNGADSGSKLQLAMYGGTGYINAFDSFNNPSIIKINPNGGGVMMCGNGAFKRGTCVDIQSTTGGLGIPSMTTDQRDALDNPLEGVLIYNTSTNSLNIRHNRNFITEWGEVIQTYVSGLSLPQMTTAQRDAILNARTGSLIYNTTTNSLNFCVEVGNWKELAIV